MEDVRRATYPPGFQYLSDDQIRGTMGGLAVHIRTLETLMAQPGGLRPQDQEGVVAILEQMQELAYGLTKGEQSNHPQIDRVAPRLQYRIDRALFGARSRPPNYYFTGTVAGACGYCHAPRHRVAVPALPRFAEGRGRMSSLPPVPGAPRLEVGRSHLAGARHSTPPR